MKTSSLLALSVAALISFSTFADEASFADEAAVLDFNRDLAPVLSKNCVACHNAKKAEGGLNLESHAALLAGGDSGAAVVAGNASQSSLVERVLSEDDPMPPDDNSVGAKRLTVEEVELLRQWIAAGALTPTAAVMRTLQWQPVPATLQPVYALAASPDGNYLSFGRGSTVSITRQLVAEAGDLPMQRLIDPAIAETVGPAGPLAPATHLDMVQSLAFSADSQRLATGGYRTVKIWRRKTEPTRELVGLSPATGLSTVSPDGRWIAQASGEQVIEITDCQSGQSHRFLKTHAAKVTALAWLSDSRQLLTCDAAGGMALTHVDTYAVEPIALATPLVGTTLERIDDTQWLIIDEQQRLHVGTLATSADAGATAVKTMTARALEGFGNVVAAAVTGPEATRAVLAMADGKLKLVALPGMEVLKEIDAQTSVRALAVDPAGSLLAALPQTGPVHVWKLETGELFAKLDQDYSKSHLVRNSDRNLVRQRALIERLAAKVPELQKVVEQEVEATKKVQEARDKAAEALTAKVAEVTTAATGVSEAEQALVAAQAAVTEAMKMVEVKTAEIDAKKKAVTEVEQQKVAAEQELAKREQALATANDSSQRAAAKVPELEQVVEQEQAQLTTLEAKHTETQSLPVATDQPTALAFNHDGTRLVVAHADQRLRLFSTRTGMPEGNPQTAAKVVALRTTSSNEVVCLTETGAVQAWDLNLPWELERTLGSASESPFSDRITALDFSPDGKLLAVGSGPPSRFGDIKLIDVETGAMARDLGEAHSDTVLSLQFSPDGRQLASGGADKLCRVFDVASGELQRALEGHTHHVLGVAWKDDARTLITASADATLKVWEVESGTQLRTIAGFSKEIAAVKFVGQTSEFVLASTDGNARLYNADNGQQVRAFGGASNALYAVALSAESKQVYSGGQTGQIWAWQLDDAKLLRTLP